MMLAASTRIGPYEILDAIGAGGMGEVYKAHDTRLGRDVAIKVIPTGLAGDPERLQRFEQEARERLRRSIIPTFSSFTTSAPMRALRTS
jgi:serine/threonine protein kinase